MSSGTYTIERSEETKMGETQRKCLLSCTAFFIIAAVIIAITLISMSFQGIHYYEYGFKRNRNTDRVDTSKVYTNGRYFVGPSISFKTFPADIQNLRLEKLDVASKDSATLELTVYLQYQLRKDSLKLLHDDYDVEYEEVIDGSAQEAIKQTTVLFATEDFITKRKVVEDALFEAVKNRLEDKCCSLDCSAADAEKCLDCVPTEGCTQHGLYVTVHYFQMLFVYLPKERREESISALLKSAEALKAQYEQNATIVAEETNILVQEIKNQADEIRHNATAEASLIKAKAQAEAKAIVEKARIEGLEELFQATGITDPTDKSTINYLRTLREKKNTYITVGYEYLVTSP